jgi:two-component system, response regulator YesN
VNPSIVDEMLEAIDRQIANPNLSLQWLAHQVIYMNADYLGKLFKQVTGERFSRYVTKKRISMAIECMEQPVEIKIAEVAERIGFGENPHYFSFLFKKHTGLSPTEYRQKNRSAA